MSHHDYRGPVPGLHYSNRIRWSCNVIPSRRPSVDFAIALAMRLSSAARSIPGAEGAGGGPPGAAGGGAEEGSAASSAAAASSACFLVAMAVARSATRSAGSPGVCSPDIVQSCNWSPIDKSRPKYSQIQFRQSRQ